MFDSPGSSIYWIYFFIIILIVSKGYFFFFKNKNMHKNRILTKRICPFCKELDFISHGRCSKCNKSINSNTKNVVCYHCGYIGEMDNYNKNTEFVVTLLLWALFTFPAIIYYFLYRNRKICRSCERMIRKSDF